MKKLFLLIALAGTLQTATAQRTLTDTIMGLHEHNADINRASFSMDGRRLISAGLDRTVIFYDAINWFEIMRYSHYDEVTSAVISRDNAIIASASKDKYIKIYFLDSSKFLEFQQESDITGMVFDFGMRFLFTSSSDGNIRTYDLKKGIYTGKKFPMGQAATSISVSHNGFLFAGLQNGDIKVLNNMGKEVKVLTGHKGAITDLHFVFANNQSWLASAADDYTIKIWDVKVYKELKTLTGHTWRINNIELSRDLKYLVSASNDATSKIWDLSTGTVVVNIPSKGEASRSISISADNGTVATTSIVREPRKEYIVYLWTTGLAVEKPAPKPPVSPSTKPQPTTKPAPGTKPQTPPPTPPKTVTPKK